MLHCKSHRFSITLLVIVALAVLAAAPHVIAQQAQPLMPNDSLGDSPLEKGSHDEVIDLHQFLEDWFNGVLPPTNQAFDRFDSVMAERFLLISPNGVRSERGELVDRLRDAHGIWRQNAQPGRIWIENIQVRHIVGSQAMVLYEEWQEIDGEARGRLSTVVFQRRDGTPNGVEWLHLHEVWMPD